MLAPGQRGAALASSDGARLAPRSSAALPASRHPVSESSKITAARRSRAGSRPAPRVYAALCAVAVAGARAACRACCEPTAECGAKNTARGRVPERRAARHAPVAPDARAAVVRGCQSRVLLQRRRRSARRPGRAPRTSIGQPHVAGAPAGDAWARSETSACRSSRIVDSIVATAARGPHRLVPALACAHRLAIASRLIDADGLGLSRPRSGPEPAFLMNGCPTGPPAHRSAPTCGERRPAHATNDARGPAGTSLPSTGAPGAAAGRGPEQPRPPTTMIVFVVVSISSSGLNVRARISSLQQTTA